MNIKFYITKSGRKVVEEFVSSLPDSVKYEFFEALSQLERGLLLRMPLSKPLFQIAKGLHELRIRDKEGNYRFIYYIKTKDAIYVLHGFKKKQNKISSLDIKTVLKRLKEI